MNTRTPKYYEEVKRHVKKTRSVAWIAKRLGVSINDIAKAARRVEREQGITLVWACNHKQYWGEDAIKLEVLAQEKLLVAPELAKKLGRTRSAVVVRLERDGITTFNRQIAITANQAAAVLGVHANTMYNWIALGVIKPTRSIDYCAFGQKGKRYVFRWDDLYEWVSDEDTWPLWRIEAITDPDLREHARQVRTYEPWLTLEQAAKLRFVHRKVINELVLSGTIPARRIGGRWYVRREQIHNVQLRCERGKV